MAPNPTTIGLSAAMLVGLAMVAMPWMASGRDITSMPAKFTPADAAAQPLFDALSAHDAACRAGDVAAFTRCVTDAYLDTMSRSLAALDRKVDPEMLRTRAVPGSELRSISARNGCFGSAKGARACVLGKPAPGHLGTLGIAFAFEGDRWRIDRVVHQPQVSLDDATLLAVVESSLLEPR